MILEAFHEGHEVPCPHCGHVFHVAVGEVTRHFRGDDSRASNAMVIAIIGLALAVYGCFPVGLVLGGVAWFQAHRVRMEALRAHRQIGRNTRVALVLAGVAIFLSCLYALVMTFPLAIRLLR